MTDELPKERSPMEMAAFAAWVNVPVDKIPPEFRAPTCEHTMAAWKRVAEAIEQELQPEIDRRVAEERAKSAAMQDLAYFNGAKQYATIAAQSEDAAREWLQNGCGNRQSEAIKALAQFEKENSHEQG